MQPRTSRNEANPKLLAHGAKHHSKSLGLFQAQCTVVLVVKDSISQCSMSCKGVVSVVTELFGVCEKSRLAVTGV